MLSALLFISANAQKIVNPGFESESDAPYKMHYTAPKGSVTGKWVLACHDVKGSQGDVSVTSTEKYSGDKSMEVKLEKISARYFFLLTHDLKNVAPGKYSLRFFAKADEAGVPFRVDVVACGGDKYAVEKELVGSSNKDKNGVYPVDRAGYQAKTSEKWTEYIVNFDASQLKPEDMEVLRLVIRPNCEKSGLSPVVNSPMTYWFDDFELVETK